MKIMISACLAGDNCKYNGGNNRNEKILRLMEENEVISVCPEPQLRCKAAVRRDIFRNTD